MTYFWLYLLILASFWFGFLTAALLKAGSEA